MPNPDARATDAGPVVAHDPLHAVLRDERLHGAREREAEDERPQRLPEHEERLAQRIGERAHDRTNLAIAAEASATFSSAARAALGERIGDAMAQVLVEQLDRDRLQRLRHRGDLREHIDAVRVFVDHALHAAHLAFDAAEALLHVRLLVLVSGHPGTIPP